MDMVLGWGVRTELELPLTQPAFRCAPPNDKRGGMHSRHQSTTFL